VIKPSAEPKHGSVVPGAPAARWSSLVSNGVLHIQRHVLDELAKFSPDPQSMDAVRRPLPVPTLPLSISSIGGIALSFQRHSTVQLVRFEGVSPRQLRGKTKPEFRTKRTAELVGNAKYEAGGLKVQGPRLTLKIRLGHVVHRGGMCIVLAGVCSAADHLAAWCSISFTLHADPWTEISAIDRRAHANSVLSSF